MINCQICGASVHVISRHLQEAHPGVSLDDYRRSFPSAPIASPEAIERAKQLKEERAKAAAAAEKPEGALMAGHATVVSMKPVDSFGATQVILHELFEIDPEKHKEDETRRILSRKMKPIKVTYLQSPSNAELVPEVDKAHVWDNPVLKDIAMAFELNIPIFLYGHAGTGKTTDIEQFCARTNRPMVRVQHTINMEESHVIGEWKVRAGVNGPETYYQPGLLPLAMRNGWTYLADEYDFGVPAVLALYQPVLEGKPLVIKDAPDEWRIVKPHPHFRFAATGNTNGTGDSMNLYTGTQFQNMANFERFGFMVRKNYMPPEQEVEIIVNQTKIAVKDAENLVKFAQKVRENFFSTGKGMPISLRSLIIAAKIGMLKGTYRVGLQLAYMNRLTDIDREAADGFAQRIFG